MNVDVSALRSCELLFSLFFSRYSAHCPSTIVYETDYNRLSDLMISEIGETDLYSSLSYGSQRDRRLQFLL